MAFFSENVRLFWFVSKQFVSFVSLLYKTESFDVLIELKQTEDHLKQFDTAHISLFFRKFRVVLFCFETVLFVSVVLI